MGSAKKKKRILLHDFRLLGGKHCETSALSKVAAHGGFPVSEEMLLGVGGGVGMIYWQAKNMRIPFIGFRNRKPREILVDGYKRLGGKITISQTSEKKKAFESLVGLLEKGLPVVCYGDIAHLPYFAAPKGAHFGAHAFVVYGIDEEKDRAFISDRGRKWITVTLKELALARSSKEEPFPPRNALLKIEHPKKIPDWKKAVTAGIKDSVKLMTKPPIKNFGLPGLLLWASLLPSWGGTFRARDFLNLLSNTFIYIETGGSGGGAFRKMYAGFLREAATLAKKPRLADAAVLFDESARKWSELAHAVLSDGNPSLKWMKELLYEKNRLFEDGPFGHLETMLKINEAFDALEDKAVRSLSPKETAGILLIMGDKIREIHALESNAFKMLEKSI